VLARLRRQAFRIALALLSIGATFQWIAPTNSAEDLSESPSHVRALASGPDGGLWFIEARANQIGRMSTSGELKEFPVPGAI